MRLLPPLLTAVCLVIIMLAFGFKSEAAAGLTPSEMARAADLYGYDAYQNYVANGGPQGRDVPVPPLSGFQNGLFNDGAPHAPISRIDPRFIQAVAPERAEPSRIESFYRERTGDNTLVQFGYNLLKPLESGPVHRERQGDDDDRDAERTPLGAVQDDYILQAGDELTIVMTGERRSRQVHTVDSGGTVVIDPLPPMTVAGRTLGEVRTGIREAMAASDYRGEISVSVSGIRQIGVLVAGHVSRPGRQVMNAFGDVIDALYQAGGIDKSGSLRDVRLVRGGRTTSIDLYAFMIGGTSAQDLSLRDGDRIIVPPLGPTAAVTGDVKQPGIFELRTDGRAAWRANPGGDRAVRLSLPDILGLAGGVLSPGGNSFILRDADARIINLAPTDRPAIGDGAIVTVTRNRDRLSNAVEVAGHSRRNGVYALGDFPTLGALFASGDLLREDTYPLFAVIERFDDDTMSRAKMAFSPLLVARGEDDRQLESGDILTFFSQKDIAVMMAEQGDEYTDEAESDRRTAGTMHRVSMTAQAPAPTESGNPLAMAPFDPALIDFAREGAVTVNGAVRRPGAWPVGNFVRPDDLVAVAGGFKAEADESAIETVSRVDGAVAERRTLSTDGGEWGEIRLLPGDQMRVPAHFRQAVDKSVRITGEVVQPGTYDLMRGDTLSTLIARAGGLTAEAYPPGAVLSRKAERRREEQTFRAAAQQLEQTVSVHMNARDKGASLTPEQVAMARDLAAELRAVQAVGRVTVEADPAALAARPELDLILEDGDRLHIPKRPLAVRVSGEVFNPASLLFEEDKDAADYVAEAGGTTYYADTKRMFVVYPDGSARPIGRWNGGPEMIIPGSTIVVPRDPKPFNFIDSFKDITQILTNMAITGVFVEDIATDEN